MTNSESKPVLALWRWIRCLTIAPWMAALVLAALWVSRREIFAGSGHFLGLFGGLVALPVLCYPVRKRFHSWGYGSIGQRVLAMLFAVSGYAAACIINAAVGAGREAWIICLEYLLGGLVVLVSNYMLNLEVSGHICGVVGSALLLAVNGLAWAVPVGAAISLLAAIASLKTENHTVPEMISSCFIPFLVYLPLRMLAGV